MAVKISSIQISNFKVFSEKTLSFSNSDFIVFDGPNGFGKTSFYDAIELFFTGKIRRYDALSESAIDGRSNFIEHPLLNQFSNSGDMFIKADVLFGNEKKTLKRVFKRAYLTEHSQINNMDSQLFELSSFQDPNGTFVEDEVEYLESLIGKDFISNFKHLNYIEQEENTFYLKSRDKDKKDAISHLFNTTEFEKRIEKLKKCKNALNTLCNSERKRTLTALKSEIDEIKKQIKKIDGIEYSKLINWKRISWDEQSIDFNSIRYSDLLGDNGQLRQLIKLITNREDYKSYLNNKKIQKIIDSDLPLKEFLNYRFFLDEFDDLKRKDKILKIINSFLKDIDDLFSWIKKETIIPGDIIEIINDSELVDSISEQRSAFLTEMNALTGKQQLVSELKSSRDNFITQINKFDGTKGICQLCGYDWGNYENFSNQIEQHTLKLEEIFDDENKNLQNKILIFKENEIAKTKDIILKFKGLIEFDPDFFKRLSLFHQQYGNRVAWLDKELESITIDIQKYLNKAHTPLDEKEINSFKNDIQSKIKEVNASVFEEYYDNLFSYIFDSDYKHLDSIKVEDLNRKVQYIDYMFSLHNNSLFEKKQREYTEQEGKYNKAKVFRDEVNKVLQVYEDSLKQFHKKVIQDIEILFHVYSARIVQDYQGGLGLFINNDKGIKFVENPTKSYDAIFNMSSGQLSALIISFTLALNKKYSKSKMLLIDDPIQTLDDINIASFTDLLRNEFSDRQIIISTHEDQMSAFMRYKFEKYGLKTKRINLRKNDHENE